jgi:hypothetical protein
MKLEVYIKKKLAAHIWQQLGIGPSLNFCRCGFNMRGTQKLRFPILLPPNNFT